MLHFLPQIPLANLLLFEPRGPGANAAIILVAAHRNKHAAAGLKIATSPAPLTNALAVLILDDPLMVASVSRRGLNKRANFRALVKYPPVDATEARARIAPLPRFDRVHRDAQKGSDFTPA